MSRTDSEPTRTAEPHTDRAGDPELTSGSHVGRYVVLYRIGRGGMGIVYAAYDPELDRKVAIKVMRPRRRRRDVESRGMMLREAQALAKLAHPNVVAIHDVGLLSEKLWVAMDHLDGQTLRRWATAERRSVRAIVEAYLQAGEGLAAAHAAGLVHRDFKPDNAIIGKDGRVQVLDFGLALARGHSALREVGGAQMTPSSENEDRTAGGRAGLGTPGYTSPEQHRGDRTGPATDQFAFCVSLYEALYRRAPFVGEDAAELVANVTGGRIKDPPRDAKVPARLRRIVYRGLSVEPERRYPSMRALLDALHWQPVRRRFQVATGVALVGVGAAAVWSLRPADPGPSCSDNTERLAAVWDETTAAQAVAAFGSSARPYAARTIENVRETVDAYAQGWLDAHRDACESFHERAEQSQELFDLRMACLMSRRDSLSELGRVLQTGDDEVVDNAVQAAAALPPLEPCADAVALRERVPPPTDAATRTQVEGQRTRLARARVLWTAGKLDDAVIAVRAVVVRAREIDYAPLVAEALYQLGQVLELTGQYVEAASTTREAALGAEVAGDEGLLADTRIKMVAIDGDRLGRLREGHLWADLARATIERLGGDAAREARLANNLAFVVAQESSPEHVLRLQRRAVALAGEATDVPAIIMGTYHNNLAATLGELGHYDEAFQRAEEAHQMWTQALGEDHFITAMAKGTKGLLYDYQGDYASALKSYEAAMETMEESGAGNAAQASILTNIGIVAVKLGDNARGEAAFRKNLEIAERTVGKQSNEAAQAYQNIGSVLGRMGRYNDAHDMHRTSVEIREKLFGPDHLQLVSPLEGMANALEGAGHPEQAIEFRERLVAIAEKTYGHDHAELCTRVANLAYNLMALDRLPQARTQAERAWRLADSHPVKVDERAFARLVLARVLTAQRTDAKRVRTLVDTAVAELKGLPAPEERRVLAEIARLQGWPHDFPGTEAPSLE